MWNRRARALEWLASVALLITERVEEEMKRDRRKTRKKVGDRYRFIGEEERQRIPFSRCVRSRSRPRLLFVSFFFSLRPCACSFCNSESRQTGKPQARIGRV